VQLGREEMIKTREKFSWECQVAELFDGDLHKFEETCKLANVFATIAENGRVPHFSHDFVCLPVCFENRPTELVIWKEWT
jgi:hypothetical protein